MEDETSERLENLLLSSMAGVNGNSYDSGGIFDSPETIQTLEHLGNGTLPMVVSTSGGCQPARGWSNG